MKISSIISTCNSVIIDWVLPLDENDIPYDVRVRYSYTIKVLPVTFSKTISGGGYKPFARSFQVEFVDLPSDTSVKFSFSALSKKETIGPATYYTIKTKKPSESVDVMLRSESTLHLCRNWPIYKTI